MIRTARERLFFLMQRGLGSRAGRAYRILLDQEKWTPEQLRLWQKGEFDRLAGIAVANCPFYRDRLHGITNPTLEDFPIITKESLSDHFMDIMSDRLHDEYERGSSRGYSWLKVTSGGTTGIPTTVIHDADFRDKDRAARVYELHLAGFPFGTPHFRLWGSMHDIRRTKASLQQRVLSSLFNETLANAFQMDDSRIESYIRMFNQSRIRHMIAYVDAIHQISVYAERKGIRMRAFDSIITTGGTLTPEVRADLQRVFGARIHNKYGSRDAGEIACDCSRGRLHVFPHLIVETVDDAGRRIPPGETGRILVTFLGNDSFPLIRFDITDMAARSDTPCDCGLPFPVLQRLEGRTTDFLYSMSGGFVSPVYIRHVVGVMHGSQVIRRFQLVQETAADYRLTLQPETGVGDDTLYALHTSLLADLRAVLGDEARIRIEHCSRIPETDGGKFRYIINRTRTIS